MIKKPRVHICESSLIGTCLTDSLLLGRKRAGQYMYSGVHIYSGGLESTHTQSQVSYCVYRHIEVGRRAYDEKNNIIMCIDQLAYGGHLGVRKSMATDE